MVDGSETRLKCTTSRTRGLLRIRGLLTVNYTRTDDQRAAASIAPPLRESSDTHAHAPKLVPFIYGKLQGVTVWEESLFEGW